MVDYTYDNYLERWEDTPRKVQAQKRSTKPQTDEPIIWTGTDLAMTFIAGYLLGILPSI